MVKTTLPGEKACLKKGAWSPEEDLKLVAYIKRYGIWNWSEMPKHAGLARSGKSCRLRWMNYLRPDIKHGNLSREEVETIFNLHEMLGNRWSAIAAKLPGRTDNEIKNYWHTHLKKRCRVNSSVLPKKFQVAAEASITNHDEATSNQKKYSSSETDQLHYIMTEAEGDPKASIIILENLSNSITSVLIPPPQFSTENLASFSSVPGNYDKIHKSQKVDHESSIAASDTFGQIQSLWTKPVASGSLEDSQLTIFGDSEFVVPAANSQVWQQEPILACHFYEDICSEDWVNIINPSIQPENRNI